MSRKKKLKKRRPARLTCLYYILIGIIAMFVVFVAIAKADETDGKTKASQTARMPIESRSTDLLYRGDGETAKQLSETAMTREEADVLAAQNGEGRWAIEYEPTPDHINQEKVDDEISENFDLFCDVVYAESGNQGDLGMRYVADCIINRMRCGEAFADTMKGVLTAEGQFACISDGGAAKWKGHEKEEVRKICQEELEDTTNTDIYYFRTGHFFDFGVPKFQYKDHYFSGR